ncbi:MAG: ankyrin repeat domain-containing protein [Cyclobacteriaceae bacterium]|jgi:ankyrin repeat protein
MTDLNLFDIIILDDKKLFEKLISSEIDINILNDDGNSLLHIALSYHRFEIASSLIEKGINVNIQNKKGKTAMHYAASPEALEIAKLIIKNGGDLNIQDNYGNTPLWTATFNANEDYHVVSLFVENNANPFHKNKNNKSPLDFATEIDDKVLINLLSSGISS